MTERVVHVPGDPQPFPQPLLLRPAAVIPLQGLDQAAVLRQVTAGQAGQQHEHQVQGDQVRQRVRSRARRGGTRNQAARRRPRHQGRIPPGAEGVPGRAGGPQQRAVGRLGDRRQRQRTGAPAVASAARPRPAARRRPRTPRAPTPARRPRARRRRWRCPPPPRRRRGGTGACGSAYGARGGADQGRTRAGPGPDQGRTRDDGGHRAATFADSAALAPSLASAP